LPLLEKRNFLAECHHLARLLLALICDWIIEGFGTADLKAQKVLLDELTWTARRRLDHSTNDCLLRSEHYGWNSCEDGTPVPNPAYQHKIPLSMIRLGGSISPD
jgi:hypothetical protein